MAATDWTVIHGRAQAIARQLAGDRQIDAARALNIPFWRYTRIERALTSPSETERGAILTRYPMLRDAFAQFEERHSIEAEPVSSDEPPAA